jgi:MFS family permease
MDAKKIPLQIWIISVSSMLITASAAMFFGVFGLFLASIGVTTTHIGIIEGFVEGAGYVLKVVSGIISDYLRRRKLILTVGYLFSAMSKIIAALFFSFPAVIAGRIIDRIGNGLQASPRDAFVCDYASRQLVGMCFGIRQGLGTFGSILGVLFLFVLLKDAGDGFRRVFTVASLLAVAAFVLIAFCIKDHSNSRRQSNNMRPDFSAKKALHLGREYWYLMIIVAIFMSCRMGETLIMLHGKIFFHLTNNVTEEIMLVYNVFSAIAAFLTGRFANRFCPATLLVSGAIVTILSLVVMAVSINLWMYLGGVVLWGLQIGLMHNVFCAEISKLVPTHYRGTGFSFYYLITAASLLLANFVCGRFIGGEKPYAFIYCVGMSTISCLSTMLLIKRKRV